MPPADDANFEKFWAAFYDEASQSRGQRSAERSSFRSDIFNTHKTCFEVMERLHVAAEAAINWASKTVHDSLSDDAEDDALAEYFDTLVVPGHDVGDSRLMGGWPPHVVWGRV